MNRITLQTYLRKYLELGVLQAFLYLQKNGNNKASKIVHLSSACSFPGTNGLHFEKGCWVSHSGFEVFQILRAI